MSEAIRIEKEEAGARGRYVARVAGESGEAELVYTVRSPGLISAEHTEAPAGLRGAGAAAALVAHMFADARAAGFKIVPVCPCVRAQYRKHPEWSDVMARAQPAP